MISSVCAKAVFLKNFNPIKFADKNRRLGLFLLSRPLGSIVRAKHHKKNSPFGELFYGGRSRDRTCDPYRVKVMLYR